MIRRIFVNVGRGVTDKTAACVFPWEKPILERIHGGSVEEVSIDEMCNLKGAARVEKNRSYQRQDGVESEVPPNLRAQLEAMATVGENDDPSEDPQTEYNRLVEKYGMDAEVKMPVVSVVYGLATAGAFEREVQDAVARAKTEAPRAKRQGKPVEEMSINEVRKALRDAGIDYDQKAKLPELRDQLATATA